MSMGPATLSANTRPRRINELKEGRKRDACQKNLPFGAHGTLKGVQNEKIISWILILSFIIAALPLSAFAAENQTDEQNFLTQIFQLDGKTVSVRYQEKNGVVSYAEVGNDVIANINNEIFVNGVKVATYSERHTLNVEDGTNQIAPRTG